MSKYIKKCDVEQALIREAEHLMRYGKYYLDVSDILKALIGVVQRFPAIDIEDNVNNEETEVHGGPQKYVALDDVLKLRKIFPYDGKGDTHFTLGVASACEYVEHLPVIEIRDCHQPK